MNAASLTRSRAAFAVSLGLIGFLLNVFEIPLAAGTSLVLNIWKVWKTASPTTQGGTCSVCVAAPLHPLHSSRW